VKAQATRPSRSQAAPPVNAGSSAFRHTSAPPPQRPNPGVPDHGRLPRDTNLSTEMNLLTSPYTSVCDMNAMRGKQPPENPGPTAQAIQRGKGMEARESGGSPQRRDGRRGTSAIHCDLTVALRLNALSVARRVGPSRAAELNADTFSQEATEATEKTISVPSVTCEKQNAASRNFHVPFLHAGSSRETLCARPASAVDQPQKTSAFVPPLRWTKSGKALRPSRLCGGPTPESLRIRPASAVDQVRKTSAPVPSLRWTKSGNPLRPSRLCGGPTPEDLCARPVSAVDQLRKTSAPVPVDPCQIIRRTALTMTAASLQSLTPQGSALRVVRMHASSSWRVFFCRAVTRKKARTVRLPLRRNGQTDLAKLAQATRHRSILTSELRTRPAVAHASRRENYRKGSPANSGTHFLLAEAEFVIFKPLQPQTNACLRIR
jgi:hypothetical protein